LDLSGALPGGGHRAGQPVPAPGEELSVAQRAGGDMTRSSKVLIVAGLVGFVLIVLVPFWWIASMSFKTYDQIQFATSTYVPRPCIWENYTGLWFETRFPLWLRNSLITAVVVTATTTVIASLAGYAVARLRFPGREAVASLILILY